MLTPFELRAKALSMHKKAHSQADAAGAAAYTFIARSYEAMAKTREMAVASRKAIRFEII